jgi:hypothetical protein
VKYKPADISSYGSYDASFHRPDAHYYRNGVLVQERNKRIISRDHPRIYFAYGSNLDVVQMQERCDSAQPIVEGALYNYQLYFSGVASVRKMDNVTCPGAFWEVETSDIEALDRYEGYPNLYTKVYSTVVIEGESKPFFFYVMNGVESVPSASYLATLLRGYCDWSLDPKPLVKAYDQAAMATWNRLRKPAATTGRGFSYCPSTTEECKDVEGEIDYADDDLDDTGFPFEDEQDRDDQAKLSAWFLNKKAEQEEQDESPLTADELASLAALDDGEPVVTPGSRNAEKITGLHITTEDCEYAGGDDVCPLLNTMSCVKCLMFEEDNRPITQDAKNAEPLVVEIS